MESIWWHSISSSLVLCFTHFSTYDADIRPLLVLQLHVIILPSCKPNFWSALLLLGISLFTHRLKTYLHHGGGVWEHGSLYTGEASVSRQEGGRAKSAFNPDARMDHFCLEVMLHISPSRTETGHLKQKTTSRNKLSETGKFGEQGKKIMRWLVCQKLNVNYFFLCLMQVFQHNIQDNSAVFFPFTKANNHDLCGATLRSCL